MLILGGSLIHGKFASIESINSISLRFKKVKADFSELHYVVIQNLPFALFYRK